MNKKCTFALGFILLAAFVWAGGQRTPAQQEKPEVSIMVYVRGAISFENNPIIQKAEELSGYRLNIEGPPSANYFDRMQVVMASANVPDLHQNGVGDDFERFARDGLLADITDLRLNYPNLMSNLTPEQWEDGRSATTGRIMAMPRSNATDYWGFVIRQDWLDNLGLSVPSTLEEFAAVARAFTFDDPNKSGRRDTYGWSFSRGIWSLGTEFLKTAFGMSTHDGFPDWNDEYTVRWLKPGYVPYLTYLRNLREAGSLDPEWFTQARNAEEEKFLQGRIGMLFMSQNGLAAFFDNNPNLSHRNYTFAAPLISPVNGERRMAAPPSAWFAFLPSADGDVESALGFLDWANSEEGFKLFHFGIQGVHYNSYNMETRQIDRTAAQVVQLNIDNHSDFNFANAFMGRRPLEGGVTPATQAKFNTEWPAVRAQSRIIELPFVKVPELTAVRTEVPDAYARINTMEERYILGEISLAEFETELSRFTGLPVMARAQTAYREFMLNWERGR